MAGFSRFSKGPKAGSQKAAAGGPLPPGNDAPSNLAPPQGDSTMNSYDPMGLKNDDGSFGGEDFMVGGHGDFGFDIFDTDHGHNDFGQDFSLPEGEGGGDDYYHGSSFRAGPPYDQTSVAGSPAKAPTGGPGGGHSLEYHQPPQGETPTMNDGGGVVVAKQQGQPSFNGFNGAQESGHTAMNASTKMHGPSDQPIAQDNPLNLLVAAKQYRISGGDFGSSQTGNRGIRAVSVAQKPSGGAPSNNRPMPPMADRTAVKAPHPSQARQGAPRFGGTGRGGGQGWNDRIFPMAPGAAQGNCQDGRGMGQQQHIQQQQTSRNTGRPFVGNRLQKETGRSAAHGSGTTSSLKNTTTESSINGPSAVSPFPGEARAAKEQRQEHGTYPPENQARAHCRYEKNMGRDSFSHQQAPGQMHEQPSVEGDTGRRTIELEYDMDGNHDPRRISLENFEENAEGNRHHHNGRTEMEFDELDSRFDARRVSTEGYRDGEPHMGYDQDDMPFEMTDHGMDGSFPYGDGNGQGFGTEMDVREGGYEMAPSQSKYENMSFDELKEVFMKLNETTKDLHQEVTSDLLSFSVSAAYIQFEISESQAVVLKDMLDEAEVLEDDADDAIMRFQQKYEDYLEMKKEREEREAPLRNKVMHEVESAKEDDEMGEKPSEDDEEVSPTETEEMEMSRVDKEGSIVGMEVEVAATLETETAVDECSKEKPSAEESPKKTGQVIMVETEIEIPICAVTQKATSKEIESAMGADTEDVVDKISAPFSEEQNQESLAEMESEVASMKSAFSSVVETEKDEIPVEKLSDVVPVGGGVDASEQEPTEPETVVAKETDKNASTLDVLSVSETSDKQAFVEGANSATLPAVLEKGNDTGSIVDDTMAAEKETVQAEGIEEKASTEGMEESQHEMTS